jgi:hypothetical protein
VAQLLLSRRALTPIARQPYAQPVKLRHVAVLALTGWYLVAATARYFKPGSRAADGKELHGWMLDSGNDFSDWSIGSIVGAYETAAGCEAARQSALRYGLTLRAKPVDDAKGLAWASAKASERAECIASDDPRLKRR